MSDLFDPIDDGDESPICPECGVSALPSEVPGAAPACENPDCVAYGEGLEHGG